jgi:DNA-binding MarR family transcriptional regulator
MIDAIDRQTGSREINERISRCIALMLCHQADHLSPIDARELEEEVLSLIDWASVSGVWELLDDLVLRPVEAGLLDRRGPDDGARLYHRFLRALRGAAGRDGARAGLHRVEPERPRPAPETDGHARDEDSSRDRSRQPGRDLTDGMVLWAAANAWQRAMRAGLASLGLTHVQFMLLRSLARPSCEQSAVTQAMLSRRSGVDEMMASQVIRTLEAKGLVRRDIHGTDSRAKVVALTGAGIEALFTAVQLAEQTEREFFRPMGDHHACVRAALETVLPQS